MANKVHETRKERGDNFAFCILKKLVTLSLYAIFIVSISFFLLLFFVFCFAPLHKTSVAENGEGGREKR